MLARPRAQGDHPDITEHSKGTSYSRMSTRSPRTHPMTKKPPRLPTCTHRRDRRIQGKEGDARVQGDGEETQFGQLEFNHRDRRRRSKDSGFYGGVKSLAMHV